MINLSMRDYDYFIYGDLNSYGVPALSEKQGTIKMSINIASQSVQNNINYSNCSYIGLTRDIVTDKFVIDFNGEMLKVLYVNSMGRLRQVFLGSM